MSYWNEIYQYFVARDFPEDVLSYVSINPEEATHISDAIEQRQPCKILEIGTFVGLSTGVIALASPPECTLVCVDPSLPVAVHARTFGHHDTTGALSYVKQMVQHFGKSEKTILLQGFFTCITDGHKEQFIAYGGDPDTITIVGDTIGEFGPYDLAFLDGDHHEEVVYSDLSMIHRYLSDNGMIILHDVGGHWEEEASSAINRFIQDHPSFSIHVEKNVGFLSKDAYRPQHSYEKSQSA